jgi:alpha-glucoside transport system permease protein
VPLSVPAIASLAIFQFVWVWNDLMNALIYLQDPAKYPLTVGIQNLLGQYGSEWHLLAAGAFITMSVPLLVFFTLQRYFVHGITAGAVKG